MARFLAQRHIIFICSLLHAVVGLLNDNFILVANIGKGSTELYQIDIQTGNTIQVLPTTGPYQIDIQTGNQIQVRPSTELYQIDIQTGNTINVISKRPSSVVAVAYNPRSQTFFYSDVRQNRILRYSPVLKQTPLLWQVFTNASHIDGLAVDFVRSKLYYTDIQQAFGIVHAAGIIGEIDLETKEHSRLLYHLHLKPRAIQVDVYNRKLYFTDWGEDPGIYVINMISGENARRLVSINLYWPNGLAIDFRAGVMYWADARPGDYPSRIEVADLDGSGRRVVLEEREAQYYGLSLDSTYIYLTEWNYTKVRRIHRSNGSVSNVPSSKNFGKLHGIYAYISGFEQEMLSNNISTSTSTTLTTTITSSTTPSSSTPSTESTASEASSSSEAIMDSGGSVLQATLMQAIINPLYLVSVIVFIETALEISASAAITPVKYIWIE